jgi:hypothetical protein
LGGKCKEKLNTRLLSPEEKRRIPTRAYVMLGCYQYQRLAGQANRRGALAPAEQVGLRGLFKSVECATSERKRPGSGGSDYAMCECAIEREETVMVCWNKSELRGNHSAVDHMTRALFSMPASQCNTDHSALDLIPLQHTLHGEVFCLFKFYLPS